MYASLDQRVNYNANVMDRINTTNTTIQPTQISVKHNVSATQMPIQCPTSQSNTTAEPGMPAHCSHNSTHVGVAIMFEPRANPKMTSVIQTAINNLPSGWLIEIRHSDANAQHLSSFIDDVYNKQNLTRQRIIFINKLNNFQLRDYNMIQVDHAHYSEIRDRCIPRVILFQSDSVFCSSPTHTIDKFYQYSFIGGVWNPQTHPWLGENWCSKPGAMSPLCGFNTGLAMFDTLVMYEFTSVSGKSNWINNEYPYNRIGESALTDGELSKVDAWLGHQLNYWRSDSGLMSRIPSEGIAKFFAVEFYYEPTYIPVGVHKPWAVGRKPWEKDLAKKCNEYGLIMPPLP